MLPLDVDNELVSQFREGSEAAFNQIVLKYQERLYWVARRIVNSHQAADDIVQDVFVKAYSSIADFRGESSLYTWLYRITVNFSLNEVRRAKVRSFLSLEDEYHQPTEESDHPDFVVEKEEQEQLIREAVDKLPEKQKATFILRYYEEMSYEEISKVLKTSVGGLKANYFHALKKIGAYLKKSDIDRSGK